MADNRAKITKMKTLKKYLTDYEPTVPMLAVIAGIIVACVGCQPEPPPQPKQYLYIFDASYTNNSASLKSSIVMGIKPSLAGLPWVAKGIQARYPEVNPSTIVISGCIPLEP